MVGLDESGSVAIAPAHVDAGAAEAADRSCLGHVPVARRRLFDRLSATPHCPVVLICAPPGSGKSMLLRSWIEEECLGDRAAWVSVERGEQDGRRFWLAVVDELARATGEDSAVRRTTPAPGLDVEARVERLIDQLQPLAEPVVLVIDDLHELGSADALRCLELFIDRLPAGLRVVLSTRTEPPLGLHRLRVAGALTEIRDRDLRFTVEEARALLEADGVTLGDAAVRSLRERTEGWAAGLRLAAMSLADHPQPERFVAEFSGSERTVADYLMAEVLDRQPPEVRELLLRTSVLDRVCGPLADVLTGASGSERILQGLESANAFVTAVDAGRTWFRYNHLFADLLRLELRRTEPGIIGPLRRAAAQWLEEHGCVVEAIRQAQAACDWPRAARILSDWGFGVVLDGRSATLRALLDAFPADVRDRDAELSLVFAAGAITDGLLDEGLAYLTHAERLAATVPDTRRRRFDLLLAGKRLWVASWRGDLRAVADTMRSLDAALSAPTPRDLDLNNDLHAAALLNLGIADLWSFRTDDARRHLERGLEASRRIGRACLKNLCLSHLALASVFSGSRLAVGIELAGEAVATIDENGWGDEPVAAAAFTGLAALVIWHGRFEETEQALERARRALRPGREPGLAFLLHHTTGALRITQGRMDDALAEFAAAEEAQALLATEHTLAVELQCHIAQAQLGGGDTAAAQATLAHIALDRREESIVRATEASIHLAEGRAAEAVEVLAPALRGPDEPRPFPWRRIKALLYDAAARRQLGDAAAARASFERAIALAEPERIVLPFLLPPPRSLLTDGLPPRTAHPAMLAAILGVLNASAPQPCTETPLPDELSPAELRVLSYLPGPLTTDGIAAELYLSPNTVRTHVRRIYAKLDAHSRRQAVARARELGLLVAG